jgi:uncharacterized protein
MLPVIKNLLVLQERDRRIMRLREEFGRIAPERLNLTTQASRAQAGLEEIRELSKHIESDRKRLELDVEAQKLLIDKYSLQQYQTRKNEEYRALTHEIDTCKANISKIEDAILELMEKGEAAQKETQRRAKEAQAAKTLVDGKLAELQSREERLVAELAELEKGRNELADTVEEVHRARYERLLRSKGGSVVVGITRGVCGGCHMTLQRQSVVSCQAEQEVVACPNCGRILFFTPDMDTTLAD